ncbi:MAG: septal ring lytic transglycosylase RlpA family protein [Desulfovibrio sp.]|nr:septal ring lytic transglycosylase RlpA family protein [Desulfovibrio sp.]
MKYTRWFLFLAVAACCLLLAAPNLSDAASSRRSVNKISSEKRQAARSDVRQHRREAHSSYRHVQTASRDRKAALKRKKFSNQLRHEDRQLAENRELWLQRARDSELMRGTASWYGADAHDGETASGVNYDMYTFTAAHRTLPLGTVVRVTEQENGKSVMVCVTDRGPYVRGRIIDLSYAAAQKIDMDDRGIGQVALEVISDANGTPIKMDKAFYVHYKAAMGDEHIGPFKAFADAAAMHEALRQAHPEAEVVLGQDD